MNRAIYFSSEWSIAALRHTVVKRVWRLGRGSTKNQAMRTPCLLTGSAWTGPPDYGVSNPLTRIKNEAKNKVELIEVLLAY